MAPRGEAVYVQSHRRKPIHVGLQDTAQAVQPDDASWLVQPSGVYVHDDMM